MNSKASLVFSAGLAATLLGYMYWDSLVFLFNHWTGSDDYSHGLFVPPVSLILIWLARGRIVEAGIKNSWWGTFVMAGGLLLYWVGEWSTLYVLLHLSLWMVIVGLIISFIGTRAVKAIGFPLFYLLTCIPLPVFLYAGLSSRLQLLSSGLGVGFLQLVGVTAFREGNVIDLGPVQLQVVEACSGIRYLLPLASLALLCAYLYKDKMWKRVLLVISSIPISILVNGFRIGMIGVLVEVNGQGAAEGFSHLFEGWVLFMGSLILLIGEMWALNRVGGEGRSGSFLEHFSWRDRLQQEIRHRTRRVLDSAAPSIGPAYCCSVALLIPFALVFTAAGEPTDVSFSRSAFVDFPMQISSWKGTSLSLEKQYVDTLRFDDYLLADYRSSDGHPINLYAAYYRSQRKGQSAHSPQSCLPGGGWEISSFTSVELPSVASMAEAIHVNRALIQKDDQKQVVLYWFKQRNRILADEYLVKLYLVWDGLWRGRTDGALVRIASHVGPGETEAVVDRRLVAFASAIEPELTRYVPD